MFFLESTDPLALYKVAISEALSAVAYILRSASLPKNMFALLQRAPTVKGSVHPVDKPVALDSFNTPLTYSFTVAPSQTKAT